MLVDAYVLYNAFVVILGAIELRLWRYGVVCYLVRHHLYRYFESDIFQVPAVIVLISAASRWSDFSTSSYCWLSNGNGVLWSFVGPVLAIIAVNTVVFGFVMKTVLFPNHRVCSFQLVASSIESASR